MTASPGLEDTLAAATRKAADLIRQGEPAAAAELLEQALAGSAGTKAAWSVLARARQRLSEFSAMAASAAAARAIAPDDKDAQDLELEALILRGDLPQVLNRIAALAETLGVTAVRLDELAQVATQIADYALAERLLERACDLQPDLARSRFNLAAAQVALGKLSAAEDNLRTVTRAAAFDGDAWYNLSTLRTQTDAKNNVARLAALLTGASTRQDRFALHFALAKELEDLGRHEESFTALEHGNALRRAAMRYRVDDDVRTMRRIAEEFSGVAGPGKDEGFTGAAPIFVVGMPRSGTTLVDRILASHPAVESVGEVNDLALAIMEETRPVSSKDELVAASAQTSPGRIGANYAQRMRWRAPDAGRTVDKTPLNFLYLGIIARALPNATIVHVRRDPMDIAFAVYKTLFRMGYPFAYSLDDIGDYIIAKTNLMAHWQAEIGGKIVTIGYEDLVRDQEGESRRLLEAAGLDWDDRVLRFYAAQSPSATASAAQVRQPVHARSVGAWRRHEARLAGLADTLQSAGIAQ